MITLIVTILLLTVATIRPNIDLTIPIVPFAMIDCVLLVLAALHYGVI